MIAQVTSAARDTLWVGLFATGLVGAGKVVESAAKIGLETLSKGCKAANISCPVRSKGSATQAPADGGANAAQAPAATECSVKRYAPQLLTGAALVGGAFVAQLVATRLFGGPSQSVFSLFSWVGHAPATCPGLAWLASRVTPYIPGF